jgi:hypothetical protein
MDERTILQSGTRGVVDLEARRPTVSVAIREALGSCLTETSLSETVPLLGPKTRGKVHLGQISLSSLSLSTQLSRPLISGSTFGRMASWPEEERNKAYSVEEEAGVQQDHHPQ